MLILRGPSCSKLHFVTGHFCELRLRPRVFLKISFLFFPKQSRCYLTDSYSDPQTERSILVMVRRKLEWKLDFRALARSCRRTIDCRRDWYCHLNQSLDEGPVRTVFRRTSPWDISRLCTPMARDAPNRHVMSSFRLMRIFFQSNLF